eukprot:scaffold11187_cov30-Tisochrysis_lutea.AAC.1
MTLPALWCAWAMNKRAPSSKWCAVALSKRRRPAPRCGASGADSDRPHKRMRIHMGRLGAVRPAGKGEAPYTLSLHRALSAATASPDGTR